MTRNSFGTQICTLKVIGLKWHTSDSYRTYYAFYSNKNLYEDQPTTTDIRIHKYDMHPASSLKKGSRHQPRISLAPREKKACSGGAQVQPPGTGCRVIVQPPASHQCLPRPLQTAHRRPAHNFQPVQAATHWRRRRGGCPAGQTLSMKSSESLQASQVNRFESLLILFP